MVNSFKIAYLYGFRFSTFGVRLSVTEGRTLYSYFLLSRYFSMAYNTPLIGILSQSGRLFIS